ncbi:hypothetical protein J2Y69_002790 [Microbacterium resistens]|uniref:Uncharacterized protein n=1 Tax=Microbacterium resistens TaxID=156977 RepID=A0ABU1SF17_9MICO|nr:hypothetical protein [Microbacterium resistens]MDR6868179.1 hypothetical protein [Microbacterium resistens]
MVQSAEGRRSATGRWIGASVGIVLAGTLLLTGCAVTGAGEVPTAGAPTEEASPSASASPEPSSGPAAGSAVPDKLGFAEGAQLPSSIRPQWSDGFIADANWTVDAADDGNGYWSYKTVDGTCTASFWQGSLGTDIDVSSGDDRAVSDQVLQKVGGLSPEALTEYGRDGLLGYQLGGEMLLESREASNQNADGWVRVAARGFATPRAGLLVLVECQGGDHDAVWADVMSKAAVLVIPG